MQPCDLCGLKNKKTITITKNMKMIFNRHKFAIISTCALAENRKTIKNRKKHVKNIIKGIKKNYRHENESNLICICFAI